MLKIKPAKEAEITRIVCPYCNQKVPRLGLLKGSRVQGLTIKCGKCGKILEVETE